MLGRVTETVIKEHSTAGFEKERVESPVLRNCKLAWLLFLGMAEQTLHASETRNMPFTKTI